jgi:hypothetical protein
LRARLVGLLGLILACTVHGPSPDPAVRLPEYLRKAEEYVQSQVGPQYYSSSYLALPNETDFVDSPYTVFIRYEYLPFRRLGEPSSRVTVAVPENGDPSGFVATIEGGKVLEPRISRSQAIEIALRSYFFKSSPDQIAGPPPVLSEEAAAKAVRVELVPPTYYQKSSTHFLWKVSVPEPHPDPHCSRARAFLVSAIDGSQRSGFGFSDEACE